jgi:erythromycin esterase-like protein
MNTATQPQLSQDILTKTVGTAAQPLRGAADDYDALLEFIGDARFVLIGEATAGTHEFYRERAQITKRLIREKGFAAVAIEADWPDAFRVNHYVRGRGNDAEAIDALEGFKRFPTWIWRNADVLDFVGWLRNYNDSMRPGQPKIGFYGLDLYSLYASMEAVVAYLDKVDPEVSMRARQTYACFDNYGENACVYGFATGVHLDHSREKEVVARLVDLRRKAGEYALKDGPLAHDDFFYALENERLIRDAEQYYRTMYRGDASSWNLRDRHMAETFEGLVNFLTGEGPAAKVVVWAHNSHMGDARATRMGAQGETSLGQHVRQRHGHNTVLVGFTTYEGTITTASGWDGPVERKWVRPALPASYEALFHEAGLERSLLFLCGDRRVAGLGQPRLERAIGVIYRPDSEQTSHYFYSSLAVQFDAVLHFDRTRAVEPLERTALWHKAEVPETFPSGV